MNYCMDNGTPQGETIPLSLLDAEYLKAMLNMDSKKMRTLRRAGAKIVIPYTRLRPPYAVGMLIDYTVEGKTEEEIIKEHQRHHYEKRMALRREVAEIILEDGFWYPEALKS